MNPITPELVRKITEGIPEVQDDHVGVKLVDDGPSKELRAFLSSGEDNIRREVRRVIREIS